MQKILLVDDDPHIREVLGFALNKAGFATCEAEDGQQALTRFAAEKPDLVVLDILMPEMDGTEVCRSLRQRRADRVLVIQGRGSRSYRWFGARRRRLRH